MHLGLTEGPFVPHNLISVQESAVPLLKLQMAPRLKILMSSGSKKGTQIYYPFLSKSPGKRTPSRFPNWALTEWYLLTGHFYVSLNISPFIFPSESPVREPPPCSLTGSPWTGILSHQSHWSIYLFIYLFIRVCLPKSPKRSPPTYGEKHKVTVHGAPRRQKAYIQWVWPGSPRGDFNC